MSHSDLVHEPNGGFIYRLARRRRNDRPRRIASDRFLQDRVVTCDPHILDTAAQLKAKGGLSIADSWIAATALARSATLVHKDSEFVKFKEIAQESLKK